MNRRLLTMISLGILLLASMGVAGCAVPTPVKEIVVVTQPPEVVVVTPTPEPTPTPGPIKLTLWSHLAADYPGMFPLWEEKTKEFQKDHPEVTIEFIDIPYEGMDAKYLATFAGRENAPDMWMGKVPYFAGGLKVADPAPPDVAEKWEEIVVDNIKPYLKWKGQYYGIPFETDLGMMLYYNTDYFEEAGLDPNDPPKTMDELLEYAKKLTIYDEAGNVVRAGFAVRYAGNPKGIADKWLPFLHAWGGQLYAPDMSTSDGYLNSPKAIESLQFYADLVNKYKVANLTIGEPLDSFSRGLSAMFFREAWAVGVLRDQAPDIHYAVAPIPEKNTNPGLSLLFQDCIMVYKFSPHKDAAWDWIRFITFDPEIDLEMAKTNGTLPVHRSNFETDYVTTRPDYEAELEIINNPPSPYYEAPFINEIAFRVGQAVEEALFGLKTAEQALNDAVPDVDDLLHK